MGSLKLMLTVVSAGACTDGSALITAGGQATVKEVPVVPATQARAATTADGIEKAFRAGRIASLYVNDFNKVARAAYARVGFTEVGTFATVLLD